MTALRVAALAAAATFAPLTAHAEQSAPPSTVADDDSPADRADVADDSDDSNAGLWGLLGLAGLIGLAGLAGRKRHDDGVTTGTIPSQPMTTKGASPRP